MWRVASLYVEGRRYPYQQRCGNSGPRRPWKPPLLSHSFSAPSPNCFVSLILPKRIVSLPENYKKLPPLATSLKLRFLRAPHEYEIKLVSLLSDVNVIIGPGQRIWKRRREKIFLPYAQQCEDMSEPRSSREQKRDVSWSQETSRVLKMYYPTTPLFRAWL